MYDGTGAFIRREQQSLDRWAEYFQGQFSLLHPSLFWPTSAATNNEEVSLDSQTEVGL